MPGKFIENLERKKREAAKSTPEPPPELPTDPVIRSELLADELAAAKRELELEREARQQAERRAEQQARPASFGDFLRAKQVSKRRTWR